MYLIPGQIPSLALLHSCLRDLTLRKTSADGLFPHRVAKHDFNCQRSIHLFVVRQSTRAGVRLELETIRQLGLKALIQKA